MARLHEFKPLITAWIILALITCFASSMIVVPPLIRLRILCYPTALSIPVTVRSRLIALQTEWRKGTKLRRGKTRSGGDNYFADTNADAMQFLRRLILITTIPATWPGGRCQPLYRPIATTRGSAMSTPPIDLLSTDATVAAVKGNNTGRGGFGLSGQ